MCHQGTVIRRAVCSGATLAFTVVGLLAETGASAAVLSGPVSQPSANPSSVTAPVTYSCIQAGSASMPPVSVDAMLSAPRTGMAGATTTVTLTTNTVQIPSATSSTSPAFTQATAAGTAPSTGMSVSGLTLAGRSSASSVAGGSPLQIPAITASGSATLASAGTASIQAPSTLTLTPVGAASLALNCTIASTAAVAVQITVAQPPTPAATSGPVYACTITADAHTVTRTAQIPITLKGAGPDRVGSTDTVTLSAPGNGLGGPYPAGTSAVSFSGALPVTGAQADNVTLAGTMSDAGNDILTMSGPLHLAAAGMDHILPPARFTVTIYAQHVVSIIVVCVLKTTVTTTMTSSTTVNVAVSTQTLGTPVGAPNTGGGGSLHHASDLPMVAVGIIALLAGLWITITDLRRRQRHSPT